MAPGAARGVESACRPDRKPRKVQRAMMTEGADVAVQDREGKPVLIVEVKSRLDATGRKWAARTLRNLHAHGSVPDVPYFLLALPEAFYLWKDPWRRALEAFADGRREEVAPDYAVPAWGIVRPYLGGRDMPPHEVSTYAMKMIVRAFVADVLNSDLSRDEAPDHLWWLFDSGLYDAVRGGAFAGAVRS